MNRPRRIRALLSPQCMTHQVPPPRVDRLTRLDSRATLESPMTAAQSRNANASFSKTDNMWYIRSESGGERQTKLTWMRSHDLQR
jgi:hypothetical protein